MRVHNQKPNRRTEYLRRRTEQINNSPPLSAKFPGLKTLRVTTDYFDPGGGIRSGGMKYTVNLLHGKSLFCFNCVNYDCVGGDYDLSQPLAEAIGARRTVVEGELRCHGTRHNKERKQDTPCQTMLRFRLTLGY